MSTKTASVMLVKFARYMRNTTVQLQFDEYFLPTFIAYFFILSIWWKKDYMWRFET